MLELTNDSWLQIYKNSPGDVLPSSSLTEEGVEGIISSSQSFVTGHLSIRLDPMLQTVEFPAGIANLDTGLTNVDGDTLALWKEIELVLVLSMFVVSLSSLALDLKIQLNELNEYVT